MGLLSNRKTVNLALQGGGAHGAFTWGVLDRLLEDETLEFGWISATSAGSVNAVALVSGWAKGGRKGAKESLEAVWRAVYNAGVPELLRMNPILHSLSRSPTLAQVAGLWSPYDLNPLRIDPLRQLLEANIDFDAIRSDARHELLIAATDVATGNARLFRRDELSVESVLASACLPTIHHAVEIDGRAYWDGGFSANPDIVTLASESPTADTLIVKLSSLVQPKIPKGIGEITAHINQLAFNAPLKREVETIATIRKLSKRLFGRATGPGSSLARHRFHLVDAGHYTSSLSPQTKMKPDWGLFTYLHDAGRLKAEQWLERHRRAIGRRSTIDLEEFFINEPKQRPVGEETQIEAANANAAENVDAPQNDKDVRAISSAAPAKLIEQQRR